MFELLGKHCVVVDFDCAIIPGRFLDEFAASVLGKYCIREEDDNELAFTISCERDVPECEEIIDSWIKENSVAFYRPSDGLISYAFTFAAADPIKNNSYTRPVVDDRYVVVCDSNPHPNRAIILFFNADPGDDVIKIIMERSKRFIERIYPKCMETYGMMCHGVEIERIRKFVFGFDTSEL
jgi:hypothetical protein